MEIYHLNTEPYVNARYFPYSGKALQGPTTRFGTYHGARLKVNLDAHEIKFHSKFSDASLPNKHIHLKNATNGRIVYDSNPTDVYHLKYEVQNFEENKALTSSTVREVRGRLVRQTFRNWVHVSSDDLRHARVTKQKDGCGEFYICSTKWYVPDWLNERFDCSYLPRYEVPIPKKRVHSEHLICPELTILHSTTEHEIICRRKLKENDVNHRKDPFVTSTPRKPNIWQHSISPSMYEPLYHSIGDEPDNDLPTNATLHKAGTPATSQQGAFENSSYPNLSFGYLTNLANLTTPPGSFQMVPRAKLNQPSSNQMNLDPFFDSNMPNSTRSNSRNEFDFEKTQEYRQTRSEKERQYSNNTQLKSLHQSSSRGAVPKWIQPTNMFERQLHHEISDINSTNLSHSAVSSHELLALSIPRNTAVQLIDDTDRIRSRSATLLSMAKSPKAITASSCVETSSESNEPQKYMQIRKCYDDTNKYNEYCAFVALQEHKIEQLFIDAVEKTLFEKRNLQLKGARGFLRLAQVNLRYSKHSIEITEQANLARKKYFQAVKSYQSLPEKLAPAVNANIWKDVIATFGDNAVLPMPLKMKEFPLYEVASDFENCKMFMEMESRLS